MATVREVAIRDDQIRLGQFLKLADVVLAGGDVKEFLMGDNVLVNGATEQRRGRQLHRGDIVALFGGQLRVG